MMIECHIMGKRQTSRGCVSEKKCFVSLAEMTLPPVTFSTASHHSVLFFILSGYTSASEIRDLLVLGSLSEPVGAQPFHQFCNKVQSEILPKYPKRTLLYKGSIETLLYSELVTFKLRVLFKMLQVPVGKKH